MAKRPHIAGIVGVRKLLRRLPDSVQSEIVRLHQRSGPAVLFRARTNTPRRSGLLASMLSYRVFPKALRLRVGLLSKKHNTRAFYGYILEVGRRAQTVNVSRRTSGGVTSYKMKVSAISPSRYDIVGPRVRDFARRIITPQLRQIFDRALRRAASGG